MDQGTIGEHAGVGGQKPGGEIVCAVDDQVIATHQVRGVVHRQTLRIQGETQAGIDFGKGLRRRNRFRQAQGVETMQNLAMHVAQLHFVRIGDADGAHAGGSQISGGGRTQSACADHQHLGMFQTKLALLPHPGEPDLARIKGAFVLIESSVGRHAFSTT
jgi:hypothetical protein